MMKKLLMVPVIILAGMSFNSVADAPAKEMVCRTCHGEGGAKTLMDTYPKLNGQNKGYLVSVLKAYKAGQRKGGMSAVMSAQAAALSDKDIEELASYYASQK